MIFFDSATRAAELFPALKQGDVMTFTERTTINFAYPPEQETTFLAAVSHILPPCIVLSVNGPLSADKERFTLL